MSESAPDPRRGLEALWSWYPRRLGRPWLRRVHASGFSTSTTGAAGAPAAKARLQEDWQKEWQLGAGRWGERSGGLAYDLSFPGGSEAQRGDTCCPATCRRGPGLARAIAGNCLLLAPPVWSHLKGVLSVELLQFIPFPALSFWT